MYFKTILATCLAALPLANHAATLTNPAISPSQIDSWATQITAYAPGPQEVGVPGSPLVDGGQPSNALGEPDAATVSLGDGGQITVSFSTSFGNQPGSDFAVFENAFLFEGLVFAELGFVSVSSDGVNYSMFPSLFDNPIIDDSFGSNFRLIDAQQTNNLAGVHQTGTGTGFDLSDLLEDSLVVRGLVDLNAIQFVRITDAIGDGSKTDALGNSIFDPFPTPLSVGGFDLDAVGVLQPVPIPAALYLFGTALIALRRFS